MEIEKAIGLIKNTLDTTIKAGLCANMETAAQIIQAWQVIIQKLIVNDEKPKP